MNVLPTIYFRCDCGECESSVYIPLSGKQNYLDSEWLTVVLAKEYGWLTVDDRHYCMCHRFAYDDYQAQQHYNF